MANYSTFPSTEDQNLTNILSDGLMPNLSSQCLLHVQERLECHARPTSDNASELICEPRGDDNGVESARAHAVFLSVAVISTVLTVVLNLAVLLIICLTKKLHTIVNYIVSLLCINQMSWAFIPVIEAYDLPTSSPHFCITRYILYAMTGSLNFGFIVTITLLRYLLVVKNHNYPTNWQNLMLFTIVPVLQCVVQTLLYVAHTGERCGSFFGKTSAGYMITKLAHKQHDSILRIVIIIERIAGFTVLLFCYAKIFGKVIASRKRVISSPQDGQATCHQIANQARRICSRLNRRYRSDQPAVVQPSAPAQAPGVQPTTVHHSTTNQHSMNGTAANGQPVNDRDTTRQLSVDGTAVTGQSVNDRAASGQQPVNERAVTGQQPVDDMAATGQQSVNDRDTTSQFSVDGMAATGQPVDGRAATGQSLNDRATNGQPVNDRDTTRQLSVDGTAATGQPVNDRATNGQQPVNDRASTGQQPVDGTAATGQPVNDRAATGQQPVNDRAATGQQPVNGQQLLAAFQKTNQETTVTTQRSRQQPRNQECSRNNQVGCRSQGKNEPDTHSRASQAAGPRTSGPSSQHEIPLTPSSLVTVSRLTKDYATGPGASEGGGTQGGNGSGETVLAAPAECAAVRGRRTGRVDVVPTTATVTYLVTYMISYTPLFALHRYASDNTLCVLMPSERYYLLTIAISSGALRAVASPLVCVIFSHDFRDAFCHGCRRCWRWLRGAAW